MRLAAILRSVAILVAVALALPGCTVPETPASRRAAPASPAGRPDGGEGAEPFFFLQMADPQLPWGPRELWETAVRHANRLKPAFVVVCGDLTHGSAEAAKLDAAANEKMARAYLEVAATLDEAIPLYTLAGNHDVCNVPTPQTLAWYESHFGKPWQAFTHNGALFLTLDTNILKRPDNVRDRADEQMAWLRETLRAADSRRPRPRHKIVFLHHAVCIKALDEKEDYHNLPLGARTELMGLFHAHGVEAVFSGHYHKNASVKDGAIELVTSCSVTKPLGKDPAGFRVVKVYADRIEHQYYGYADMPEKVDLPAGAATTSIPAGMDSGAWRWPRRRWSP